MRGHPGPEGRVKKAGPKLVFQYWPHLLKVMRRAGSTNSSLPSALGTLGPTVNQSSCQGIQEFWFLVLLFLLACSELG